MLQLKDVDGTELDVDMKTEFTADWKQWIKTNVDAGQDKDGIFKILSDDGYDFEAIVEEMGYRPSRPIEEIVNPHKTEAHNFKGSAFEKNHGQPIPKAQIFIPNSKRLDTDKVDLRIVENFLGEKECAALISLIKSKKRPSEVGDFEIDKKFRTSETCDLGQIDEPFIRDIDRRIANLIGIDPAYSESIQGQYYEVGQEFKAHTDFFEMTEFETHCRKFGQRTYTVMIYLNDVEQGGETRFKHLGAEFKPTAGLAVIWNSLNPDGSPNPHTLHQAKPVEKGYKAIITKWFRSTCPRADQIDMFTKEINEHIPNFTPRGIYKTKLPKDLFERVNKFYQENKKDLEPEFVEGGFIVDGKNTKTRPSSSSLINMPPDLREDVHDTLKPLMEDWCNQTLEPTYVYGIREYHNGAVLKLHRDRVDTHIISAIVNVDQDTETDWPLFIEDNYYRRHKVMIKPGEVIFYEGGRLQHGRPQMFEGHSFANLFCHFKPVGYTAPVLP